MITLLLTSLAKRYCKCSASPDPWRLVYAAMCQIQQEDQSSRAMISCLVPLLAGKMFTTKFTCVLFFKDCDWVVTVINSVLIFIQNVT